MFSRNSFHDFARQQTSYCTENCLSGSFFHMEGFRGVSQILNCWWRRALRRTLPKVQVTRGIVWLYASVANIGCWVATFEHNVSEHFKNGMWQLPPVRQLASSQADQTLQYRSPKLLFCHIRKLLCNCNHDEPPVEPHLMDCRREMLKLHSCELDSHTFLKVIFSVYYFPSDDRR